ncbi:MAG: 3-oxo-5a-steroid 4- dehydrogenase [Claussenomyces sp. TS43310]|nr:MAG: 3-oxo-5a-steroid 4- dehydrogenase [Claussenomyces sp. TS43310]
MSSPPISIKVSNRPGKKPIRKLPATIEITSTTTVEDAKKQIARAAGGRDHNRIAILNPETQAIIKDRKALLAQDAAVVGAKELLVKDLGRQISWKGVYVIEYLGPIVIHLVVPLLRPYIYQSSSTSDKMSTVQYLSQAMIVLHFLKREFETLFVHRFSNETMPFFNVFKNSGHYWFLSGINIAYWIYSPKALTAKSTTDPTTSLFVYLGLGLYNFGEVANLNAHYILSRLRSPGGTERGIPKGFGFSWVTCPNYLFETIAWMGICLVTRSYMTLLFTVVGTAQMVQWANQKEKRYRTDFGDRYKAKKYPILPGLAYPGGKRRKGAAK